MKISKYITLEEATKSQAAIRAKIENKPNATELEAMKNVATKVFDKVREHFNIPLFVSSFFRNEKTNTLVGGSKTSQHRIGEAIDIDADVYGGVKNSEIFDYIKNNLEYDQLIWEYGNSKEPAWVHVSLKLKGKNRKQILYIS